MDEFINVGPRHFRPLRPAHAEVLATIARTSGRMTRARVLASARRPAHAAVAANSGQLDRATAQLEQALATALEAGHVTLDGDAYRLTEAGRTALSETRAKAKMAHRRHARSAAS